MQRIAPLVFCLRDEPETLTAAARAQTAMTHGDPLTIDAAELFAGASLRILEGESPISALSSVAEERFAGTPLARWVKDGIAHKKEEGVGRLEETDREPKTTLVRSCREVFKPPSAKKSPI